MTRGSAVALGFGLVIAAVSPGKANADLIKEVQVTIVVKAANPEVIGIQGDRVKRDAKNALRQAEKTLARAKQSLRPDKALAKREAKFAKDETKKFNDTVQSYELKQSKDCCKKISFKAKFRIEIIYGGRICGRSTKTITDPEKECTYTIPLNLDGIRESTSDKAWLRIIKIYPESGWNIWDIKTVKVDGFIDTSAISVNKTTTTKTTTTDATSDKTTDGTTEKTTDATSDKTTDGTTEKTTDATTDKATDGTTEKTTDATTDKTTEGTTEKAKGTTAEKTKSTTAEKSKGTTTEKVVQLEEVEASIRFKSTTNKPVIVELLPVTAAPNVDVLVLFAGDTQAQAPREIRGSSFSPKSFGFKNFLHSESGGLRIMSIPLDSPIPKEDDGQKPDPENNPKCLKCEDVPKQVGIIYEWRFQNVVD